MSHIFYSLAILGCPAGMGVMMWLMMRGNKSQPGPGPGPVHDPATQAELDQLHAQIAALLAPQPDRSPAVWPGAGQPAEK